jgi:hypothetical protein
MASNLTIITAKYPGLAQDGTRIRKGDQIVWCRKTRKVVSADPAQVTSVQQNAQREPFIDIDTMWEDDCARRCGL